MRRLVLALLLLTTSLSSQPVNWHRVNTSIEKLDPKLHPANLAPRDEKKIVAYLESHVPDNGVCVTDADGERPPRFLKAPLGRPGILYVQSTCVGAPNGPIWLVTRGHGRPQVLATLGGWGLGVQPQKSRGLHDFVIGSHMSAFEIGLEWYRFDGAHYKKISTAVAYSDDEEGSKRMAEARSHCKKCILIRYKQSDSVQ